MTNRIKPLLLSSLLILSTIALTACQSAPIQVEEQTRQLNTEVFYLDRSKLPPNAELTVILEDVSKMDVAASIIAKNTRTLNTAPPYQVPLTFNRAQIEKHKRYNVRAHIKKDGQLLYTSSESYNPFTNPKQAVKIKVTKLQAMQKPDVPLINTYWKVISLNDKRITIPSGVRELFLQFKNQNQVHGFAGCNSFMGAYKIKQFELRMSNIASTMKMCQAAGMALETSMHQTLKNTFEYTISGETLTLFNKQQQRIALFKAVYFN